MPLNSHHRYSSRDQYGHEAEQRPIPFAMNVWSATAALIVILLVILALSGVLPQHYWPRVGIAAAILVLVVRQIARRSQGNWPGRPKPDPRSTIKLD